MHLSGVTVEMANENDIPETEQIVDLARRLEEQLESGAGSPETAIQDTTSVESEATQKVLRRFENALEYFRCVRLDLNRMADDDSKLSAEPSDAGQLFESTDADSLQLARGDGAELPRFLGRFQILKVLGQGGFARVFLARDPQLNREVALKVPRPAMFTASGAQTRFEREARAAAILSHPNIVPVFESGAIGPISYIASGYCPGTSLDKWLAKEKKRGDLSVAVAIVSRLSDAVQHAHVRGVIHRDLKPANILIEYRSESTLDQICDSVRITDFGLAKVCAGPDEMLTTDGAIVGTPAYMSPEQADGTQPIGFASDIYSLGVVLYELLTGRLPLLGKTQIATLQKVASDPPPRPSKYNKSIPPELDAICLKCLNKQPVQRYHSAFDLMLDLQNWLEDRPVSAKPVSALKKFKLLCIRNPKTSIALGLATLFLVLGLSLTTWKWLESNANLKTAELEKERSQRSLHVAQAMVDDLVNNVVTDPNIDVEKRETFARQSVRLEEQLLENAAGDQRVVVAAARSHRKLGDLLFLDRFKTEEASIEYARARRLLMMLPDSIEERRTELDFLEVMEARLKARTAPATVDEQEQDAAKTLAEQIRCAQMHLETGRAQSNNGDDESAVRQFELGLKCLAGIGERNPFAADVKGRLLRLAATSNSKLGRHQLAMTQADAAVNVFLSMRSQFGSHGEFEENIAISLSCRGGVLLAQDLLGPALENYRQARQMYDELYSNDPNNTRLLRQLLLTNRRLATTLQTDGQIENAIEELQEAITKFECANEQIVSSGYVLDQVVKNSLLLTQMLSVKGSEHSLSSVEQSSIYIDRLIQSEPDNKNALKYRSMLEEISSQTKDAMSLPEKRGLDYKTPNELQ